MDKHTVISQALQLLGEHEYKEDSPTSKPCDDWFIPVLKLACAKHNWTFLARRSVLKRDSYGDHFSYYKMPDDCIKITRMEWQTRRQVYRPMLQDRYIVVDNDEAQDEMYLNYQCDKAAVEGEVPDDNAYFCDAVVHLLAARIATVLYSRGDMAQAMENKSDYLFGKAIANDRQQDWSNAQDPLRLLLDSDFLRTGRR